MILFKLQNDIFDAKISKVKGSYKKIKFGITLPKLFVVYVLAQAFAKTDQNIAKIIMLL